MSSAAGKVASGALHVGGSLARRVRSALDRSESAPAGADHPQSGWLAVTVVREPTELDPDVIPPPLSGLAERIEFRVRPAAGGKGTELAARLRGGAAPGTALERLSGSDAHAELRSALRQAKQLLEVGEVLAVDPAPHGHRSATPGGALLEAWTRRAPKGGVR